MRARSQPLPLPLDEKDKKILLEMLEYLKLSQDEEYATKHHIRSGVGLAAPQIGINKMMCALYFFDKDKMREYCLVNPQIIVESTKLAYIAGGEGCLSVDRDIDGLIYRPHKVVVKAFDVLQNKEIEETFIGFPSMVVQHEIDHLKGILFYDHIDKENPYKEIKGAIKL